MVAIKIYKLMMIQTFFYHSFFQLHKLFRLHRMDKFFEAIVYNKIGLSSLLFKWQVGLKNLDKTDGGQLFVFGGKPGDPKIGIPGKRVGYMPQVGEITVQRRQKKSFWEMSGIIE